MGEMVKDVQDLVESWRLSHNAVELQSSIIREILKDSSKPGVINFAGGLPAPELFPLEEIKQACIRVIEKHGPAALQYSLTVGVEPLRELIVERMRKQGAKVTTDCIQVTGGAQQGLDILGRVFLEPGAVVLTERPTYLGALQAFSFYGPRFVSVETDEEGVVPEDVERKMREYSPRFIYVVSNFQNPSGGCISLRRREKLAELARRYKVPIVDDNPYGELRFSGEDIPSMKAVAPDCVIQLGTFSKVISPGLRVGWICSQPRMQPIIERMKQAIDLHTNTFTQYVICEYAAAGHLDPHIERVKNAYRERRNCMIEAMRRYFPSSVRWTEPEGGLFLWVTVPQHISTSKALAAAIDQGVAYVPGKFFYSERPEDCTMRLNFCNATPEKIEEGIRRLAKTIIDAG